MVPAPGRWVPRAQLWACCAHGEAKPWFVMGLGCKDYDAKFKLSQEVHGIL